MSVKIIKDEEGKEHYVLEEPNKPTEKHPPFVRIPKKWWLERMKQLKPIEMCLWITLRAYANKEGFCYPSLKRLASDTGTTINSARKYLKILEKKGLLKIHITKKGCWRKWTYETYQI